MIAAELRGGSKPSLNEALGWIGSRVDDIYGANVGRLEDVWIDPGTGVPRWLLVKEGRFGGSTTLIPFEDATAGAGHVWVPYERDVVRDAPEIEPGAPLTQAVETALRAHYAAKSPAAISHRGSAAPRPMPAGGSATIRFGADAVEAGPPAAFGAAEHERAPDPSPARRQFAPPRRQVLRQPPPPQAPPPRLPLRPAPPVAAPQAPAPAQPPPGYAPSGQDQLHPSWSAGYAPPAPQGYEAPIQPPPSWPGAHAADPGPPQSQGWPPPERPQAWAPPAAQPDPAQEPIEALRALAAAGGSHYVEIELSGELTIRGELRGVRVSPRDHPGQR